MLFKVLFLAAIPLECIFVPWYLKALWPVKNKKSLRLKMVCSGLFVLMSVCAVQISGGEYTGYALMMLIGALFGFMGDYFLHAKGTSLYFILGLVSFLFGHVTYFVAYIVKLGTFENYKAVNVYEIAVFAVVAIVSTVGAVKIKMKFKPRAMIVACALYAVILVWMFIKASALGVMCVSSGLAGGVAACVLLIAGSFCFVLSDASLCVILFGGQKGSYPLKIFNIATYFIAQMALAATIIFVE